ncbi:MAG: hypothetical protein EOP47_25700, partial [Sphingobacteriaceae bacterium]
MKRILSVPALLLLFFFAGFSPVKAQIQILTAYTNTPNGFIFGTPGPQYVLFSVYNSNTYPISLTEVRSFHAVDESVGTFTFSNNGATYSLLYSNTSLTGAPAGITTWPLVGNSNPITATSTGVIPVITGLDFSVPANTEYRFALVTNDSFALFGIRDPNTGLGDPPTPFTFTNGGVTLSSVYYSPSGKVQFGTYPQIPAPTAPETDTFGWNGGITYQRTGPTIVITNNFSCQGGDITLTANLPAV